jgi:pimeloyl-ACP methyl ester carboxylesterase
MSNVTSKDGTTIAYDRQGEGPGVILVGGAFQYRAFDPRTAELASLLAERFTVINYDRRGRGDSSDTLPYAVQREVEDIEALIAVAGGSACLFGMSSAAGLTLHAAASGLAIPKVAVYEAPYIIDDTRPPLPDDYLEHLSELVSTGKAGEAVEYFLTQAAAVPPEFVGGMKQAPMWPGFEAVAHTLPYEAAVMGGDYKSPAKLAASVTIPVLVGDGGASPDWMRNAAKALADVLPNAQRFTLEGQMHDVAPDVLAPVLTEFYAS